VSNFPAKKYPPRDPSVPFKQKPDSGNLHATTSKLSEVSPDYFGEIAINLKDMTAVRVEDGLTIFKLSGWKIKSPSGKTYLNIKLNRWVPEDAPKTAPVKDLPDDDLDF
jgi:hypothetical protein